MLALVVAAFAALYRFGPSRISPQWRWISWGSALAALGWLLVSVLFSWYVGNFGNYNATYGSLGAVIALMTWLWLSTTVVLLGAELNSEMEHQTARDTTVGPEKPMGARGATMADTIGRPSEATRPARNPASSFLTDHSDPSHLLATHGRIIARNVLDVTARFTSAARATARARPGRALTVAALAGLVVGIVWKA
jgi:membrane protein